MSYGNWPLATFLGVSGRSAPEPSEANWEISFVPPLPVTYTNGAPAGEAAGAGALATVHPAASPQAITAKTARAGLPGTLIALLVTPASCRPTVRVQREWRASSM
jgi:hypothetical protein